MLTNKPKPVHEIRLGRIKAVIWPVEGPHGQFYSVTIARIYRDGSSWKESASFGRNDLPLVAKVADMVHTWIFTNPQQQNGQDATEETNSSEEDF
jgi:hypothetical protein